MRTVNATGIPSATPLFKQCSYLVYRVESSSQAVIEELNVCQLLDIRIWLVTQVS